MKDVKSKLTVYTGNLITRSDPLDGWTNASWLREIELTVTKFDVVKVAVLGSCSCMLVRDDSGFVRMEGSRRRELLTDITLCVEGCNVAEVSLMLMQVFAVHEKGSVIL
jgi:hypothetical protein